MPTLHLSNLFRRNAARPSLGQRAASLKASLGQVRARPASMPEPGSEEAKAAFKAACHEHTIRTQFTNEYSDLKRTQFEWWTSDSLGRAMETGEITPAECARLYPLATERELRMAEIEHELKLGALHALAFADSYPVKSSAENAGAEPDTLIAAILDGWAAWGAVQDITDDDVQAEEDGRRRALIYKAMALPLTPDSIPAKALACAWMEWVEAERPGQPRDTYEKADRLVFDLHAAIMARGVKGTAGEPRPLDLIAAAGLSVEALSIFELSALFDAADTLSSVACAMTCQPRHSVRGGDFNGAGLFVESLTHALHRTVEAVAKELRSRTPANGLSNSVEC